MATVDSKGRIVLPQGVRDRLGITPGTEVEVHEEEGRAVVEPEDDPEQIIDDLERLIEGVTSRVEQTPYGELDAESKGYVDTIRRQANDAESNDE